MVQVRLLDGRTKQGRSRVPEVDGRCRLLIVPLFRGRGRFDSLIVSRHSRFTRECDKEEIDDGDGGRVQPTACLRGI